jgi:tetraacyldisaccharide 4'-kinase
VRLILQPLAIGFRLGVALRHAAYRRGWLKKRRLERPVVSVGNLTVGGTGKTPLVEFMARTLLKLGWKPGILTRGYGRRRKQLIALLPAIGGTERVADPRLVGDEPALLARALPEVPLVICADRYRGGRLAEQHLNVNVHILDDGFQHLALARDVEVVVLDVTQELSDGALLPAGRLREPATALQRADLVIFSRTELGDPERLMGCVAQINPRARMFRSTTKLCGLREISSGPLSDARRAQEGPPPLGRVSRPGSEITAATSGPACAGRPQGGETSAPDAAPTVARDDSVGAWRGKAVQAFCGLGNPQAFFADLRRWGFTPASEEVFPDHHLYTETELRRLSQKARKAGALALVTTEKDVLNFPSQWKADLPVLVCTIQAEVVEARDFEATLVDRLKSEAGG